MAFYRTLRKLSRLLPGSETQWTQGVRAFPQNIVLDVESGVTPSNKPTVRMFMGTEPRQHRAERVWIWSVLQVRDPSRVYEIYLMKDIVGFDRRLWLTGFTNYRFAIPQFAGKTGRAIYNDVDQIYLTDPAEMFDTDMGEHGFLALSPKDTSVMLIDCERMAQVWSIEEAKHQRRKPIERKALSLWGPLDPTWNSRDEEYVAGLSKVLHYTTIHSQPWQPFPERYVYLANKVGYVWHDLERSADKAGFQVFSEKDPSDEFAIVLQRAELAAPGVERSSEPLSDAIGDPSIKTILDVTLANRPQSTPTPRPDQSIVSYSIGAPELADKTFDAVVCADELDFVPVADIPWVIEKLFDHAQQFVFASVSAQPRSRPLSDGNALRNHAADENWWSWHFAQASARHPHMRTLANDGPHTSARP